MDFLLDAPTPELLVVAGSRAHGLDTPASDTDYRGIFSAPIEDFLGLGFPPKSWVRVDPDVSLHEVTKFAGMALKANPTALEILAIKNPVISTPLADELRANFDAFLSSGVSTAFFGFARAQLEKCVARDPEGRSKPARHFLRVLQQGEHLMLTGELRVSVPNREEIFEFGLLPAEDLIEAAGDAIAHYNSILSDFPPEPDFERINEILVQHRLSQAISATR